jgi:hypothetical protein
LLLWGTVGFLLGLVVYLGGPILVGPVLPDRWRAKVSGLYFGQANSSLRRGALVGRTNAGFDIVATSFDPQIQAESVSLDGRQGYAQDPMNNMGLWGNAPFGLLTEKANVYVRARHADVGRADDERIEANDDTVAVETTDGETVAATDIYADVPAEPRLVDLHDVLPILGGASDLFTADTAKTYVVKSQSAFNSRNVVEAMTFIIAFGAGFGMVALALSQLSTGGGGGAPVVNVPLVMGCWL